MDRLVCMHRFRGLSGLTEEEHAILENVYRNVAFGYSRKVEFMTDGNSIVVKRDKSGKSTIKCYSEQRLQTHITPKSRGPKVELPHSVVENFSEGSRRPISDDDSISYFMRLVNRSCWNEEIMASEEFQNVEGVGQHKKLYVHKQVVELLWKIRYFDTFKS